MNMPDRESLENRIKENNLKCLTRARLLHFFMVLNTGFDNCRLALLWD